MKKVIKIIHLLPKAIILVFAQICAFAFQHVLNKWDIWIVSEKKTEARDNGYHFFKYIREKHPEINAYYVIQHDTADEAKVRKIGKVITYDSFKHCLYYYAAQYRVCSQVHGVRPFEEFSGLTRITFYKRKKQRQINLKHGISKDFRPETFDFRNAGFDLYISGAKPEYEYIKDKFSYPDRNIALTGFCRFDALQDVKPPEKIILVMPTFRSWLRASDSSKEKASSTEIKMFKKSTYYKAFRELINDSEIVRIAEENGYKIIFYLHYTFQPYTAAFEEILENRKVVIVAKRQMYDVQDLLVRSAVLITDYSSVFFDFAYMHKPIIYYQFDEREYREKHYQEGYFVYRRDAFGPVLTSVEEIRGYLQGLVVNDMKVEKKYLDRIKRFFIPYDKHNCDRVYAAIMRLEE